MEEIKTLENEYKFVTIGSDMTTPYKYIPENIKELSADLNKIDIIISKTKETEVMKMCMFMKSKLSAKKRRRN